MRVGETGNLGRRVGEQIGRWWINNWDAVVAKGHLKDGDSIAIWARTDVMREIDPGRRMDCRRAIEQNLIERYEPPWNPRNR